MSSQSRTLTRHNYTRPSRNIRTSRQLAARRRATLRRHARRARAARRTITAWRCLGEKRGDLTGVARPKRRREITKPANASRSAPTRLLGTHGCGVGARCSTSSQGGPASACARISRPRARTRPHNGVVCRTAPTAHRGERAVDAAQAVQNLHVARKKDNPCRERDLLATPTVREAVPVPLLKRRLRAPRCQPEPLRRLRLSASRSRRIHPADRSALAQSPRGAQYRRRQQSRPIRRRRRRSQENRSNAT